tara:strand:- start:10475 stop:11281 length:807 start_codon:yes stop_codon:yes gene_type:complete
MCLIAFGWKVLTDAPLVLAANRDEFYRRPTAAAGFWQEHPAMLAGRDLEAGGTWMGVTRSGRFAAVTNFRDPAQTAPAARSRGELAVNFLTGETTPEDYLRSLAAAGDDYAGFNLLVGTVEELWYYSNRLGDEPARPLPPGVYGLSNERLDTPWPKLLRARSRLAALIDAGTLDHDALQAAVADRSLAPEHALHPSEHGARMDRRLSAQFIVTPDYGTRATTSLTIQRAGKGAETTIAWRETRFDHGGQEAGRNDYRFAAALSPGGRG